MHELAILAIVVVAIMAATTIVAGHVGRALRRIEYILVAASVLTTLFAMAFVGAEVLMRYAFNAPIPGHLEGSELLMPIIVFLAISYTQATRGHVGMDLVLDMLALGMIVPVLPKLVVDFVGGVARKLGYAVAQASSGAEFTQLVETFAPSMILLELHLPDTDGVELLRSLEARGSTAGVVLMSGVEDRVLAAAHELGSEVVRALVRLDQLGGVQVADRIGREIAELTESPVHIL